MCGISGQVQSDNNTLIGSLSHRGPDFKGIFKTDRVVLIHDRLSIVDLSDLSNQPLENDRFVLLFNGEIYNYLALRIKYEKLGYLFKSKGDSEVVLAGFTLLGNYSFDLLDGMFAIVIYDKLENKIILVRDCFGIKPLYYYKNYNSFAFSSEIRGFSERIRSRVNTDSRLLFWAFGFIPGPETHVQDVFSMDPGSIFEYDLNRLTLNRIRNVEVVRNLFIANEDFPNILTASIKKTYATEVESAISLSGGLDSSLLSELFLHSGYKNIKAVSLYTSESKHSEELFQRRIAENLNLSAYFFDTRNILLENDFFANMDSPTVDGYNMYVVSKFAKDLNFKVLYSGLGGDELFFGYSKYRNICQFVDKPMFLLSFLRLINKRFQWIDDFNFSSVYFLSRTINTPDYIAENLRIEAKYVVHYVKNYFDTHYNMELTHTNWDYTSFDLKFYTMNQLLRDGDIFSMANSIEVRFPFLVRDVVDYSYSLSNLSLQGPNSNKEFLKNAASDTLLKSISPIKRGFHIGKNNILSAKNDILSRVDSNFYR